MSDFDEVLERLLTDASFQAALGADPRSALAGYQLSGEEWDLLNAQLVLGSGADRTVETRTSKSSVVGLLGPVAAAFGVAAGSPSTGSQTLGSAPASSSFGSAPGNSTFGSAPHLPGAETFGSAADNPTQTFGAADSVPGTGSLQSMGSGPTGSATSIGSAPVEATDYHTHVDVDGDGTWDSYTAYERGDGGVDIHVDLNHDGVDDFVGHDVDRDGLVDSAEFDTNSDGVMDTRMFDDSGDGWMDRSEHIPAVGGSSQTLGQAPPAE